MTSQEMNQYVGAKIKARRQNLGFSIDQLAVALDLSYMGVHHIESGRNGASLARLYEIAQLLKCQPTDFLPPFK